MSIDDISQIKKKMPVIIQKKLNTFDFINKNSIFCQKILSKNQMSSVVDEPYKNIDNKLIYTVANQSAIDAETVQSILDLLYQLRAAQNDQNVFVQNNTVVKEQILGQLKNELLNAQDNLNKKQISKIEAVSNNLFDKDTLNDLLNSLLLDIKKKKLEEHFEPKQKELFRQSNYKILEHINKNYVKYSNISKHYKQIHDNVLDEISVKKFFSKNNIQKFDFISEKPEIFQPQLKILSNFINDFLFKKNNVFAQNLLENKINLSIQKKNTVIKKIFDKNNIKTDETFENLTERHFLTDSKKTQKKVVYSSVDKNFSNKILNSRIFTKNQIRNNKFLDFIVDRQVKELSNDVKNVFQDRVIHRQELVNLEKTEDIQKKTVQDELTKKTKKLQKKLFYSSIDKNFSNKILNSQIFTKNQIRNNKFLDFIVNRQVKELSNDVKNVFQDRVIHRQEFVNLEKTEDIQKKTVQDKLTKKTKKTEEKISETEKKTISKEKKEIKKIVKKRKKETLKKEIDKKIEEIKKTEKIKKTTQKIKTRKIDLNETETTETAQKITERLKEKTEKSNILKALEKKLVIISKTQEKRLINDVIKKNFIKNYEKTVTTALTKKIFEQFLIKNNVLSSYILKNKKFFQQKLELKKLVKTQLIDEAHKMQQDINLNLVDRNKRNLIILNKKNAIIEKNRDFLTIVKKDNVYNRVISQRELINREEKENFVTKAYEKKLDKLTQKTIKSKVKDLTDETVTNHQKILKKISKKKVKSKFYKTFLSNINEKIFDNATKTSKKMLKNVDKSILKNIFYENLIQKDNVLNKITEKIYRIPIIEYQPQDKEIQKLIKKKISVTKKQINTMPTKFIKNKIFKTVKDQNIYDAKIFHERVHHNNLIEDIGREYLINEKEILRNTFLNKNIVKDILTYKEPIEPEKSSKKQKQPPTISPKYKKTGEYYKKPQMTKDFEKTKFNQPYVNKPAEKPQKILSESDVRNLINSYLTDINIDDITEKVIYLVEHNMELEKKRNGIF